MNWQSKLLDPARRAPQGFHSLAAPTHRGSTVIFESQEVVREGWQANLESYSYGIYGTPTTLELGARLADLEGAKHTFLVSSGQSAIALIYFSFCSAGSHVLLPSTAYGPNKELAHGLLRRCGIEVEEYDPLVGEKIAALIRPETSLIWCESPGSITMEVQDVPAIVQAAHAKSVPVALDNTYAAGILFDALASGVDVTMQALTKYISGHSDVLLGSVSVRTEDAFERVGDAHRTLGMSASPDDCSLALRGMQTLGVRLERMEHAALVAAKWLAQRPEIETVLHPALPSCYGNEFWQRDFKGSAGLFSIIFKAEYSEKDVNRFVNGLHLFKIGWSWGGVTSLIMAYPQVSRQWLPNGQLVRFSFGLEKIDDLLIDLEQSLANLQAAS